MPSVLVSERKGFKVCRVKTLHPAGWMSACTPVFAVTLEDGFVRVKSARNSIAWMYLTLTLLLQRLLFASAHVICATIKSHIYLHWYIGSHWYINPFAGHLCKMAHFHLILLSSGACGMSSTPGTGLPVKHWDMLAPLSVSVLRNPCQGHHCHLQRVRTPWLVQHSWRAWMQSVDPNL